MDWILETTKGKNQPNDIHIGKIGLIAFNGKAVRKYFENECKDWKNEIIGTARKHF